MPRPTRRAVLGGLAAGAAGLATSTWPGPPAAAQGDGEVPAPLDFRVLRNGSVIGHHRLDFRRRGRDLRVDIDIRLEVGVGPLTLYEYTHRNRETWRDGWLMGFESRTDDDGEIYHVAAERRTDGVRVTREPGAAYTVDDADILPTTYWRAETAARTRLIDTQEGRLLSVEVTPEGTEDVTAGGRTVSARRYRMRGDLDTTIWYDDRDRWVKLAFTLDGSDFEYVLR